MIRVHSEEKVTQREEVLREKNVSNENLREMEEKMGKLKEII
jgi:hypothetical protein